jgi:phosphinothricin acetyltransferase
MLEMRSVCERCHAPLSPDGPAFICSYECTFCRACTAALGRCPNCGGELLPRPRRVPKKQAPAPRDAAESGAAAQAPSLHARAATGADLAAIAAIYNQGIEDRTATFETRPRAPEDIASWLTGRHPVVVVEEAGSVIAFASTSEYRPRACYADIAEFSVYVGRASRGRGAGRLALGALFERARESGLRKLVSRVFVDNLPSRNLLAALGFREVGTYEKHGLLDGAFRDVVIVEKLL